MNEKPDPRPAGAPLLRPIPGSPRLALAHLRAADPRLARAMKLIGPFRLRPAQPATFYSFCRAILGQQLSTVVAGRIAERFVALMGEGKEATPRGVLRLKDEELRGAGLSGAKVASVRALATFWERERVTPERLARMPDQELIDFVTQVKGVGPWTAKMVLIFCLRRPNVLPHEDLGVRVGMKRIYGLEEVPPAKDVLERAAPWSPWSTVAAWYCWEVLRMSE
jgi:DNA-3-methyladenine glycosylase II